MNTSEEVLSSSALAGQSSRHSPKSRPHQIMRDWLLVVMWLACIATFSSNTFSAEHTGSILRRLIAFLLGSINQVTFDRIHFLVRKGAHFTVYFTLGWLSFRAWSQTLADGTRWRLRWAVLAVMIVVLAASLDEWHQSFIPTRTAAVSDVILDSFSGVCAQVVVAAFTLRRRPVRG